MLLSYAAVIHSFIHLSFHPAVPPELIIISQHRVTEKSRNSMHFLYRGNTSLNETNFNSIIITFQMVCVPFRSLCSSFNISDYSSHISSSCHTLLEKE
jgi:hypothetical protein